MENWTITLSEFYRNLQCPKLPEGVSCLHPYQHLATMEIVDEFLRTFYDDALPRKVILGINPGRLGAGLTGIGFTDPVQLSDALGISHSFDRRSEPSSTFIYDVINTIGGPGLFFKQFLISSVSPLGFVYRGKNINYYEIANWRETLVPYITQLIEDQVNWNIFREECFCIGQGDNYRFLNELNDQYGWFGKITVLPHPRWVMQYKRKDLAHYVEVYAAALLA